MSKPPKVPQSSGTSLTCAHELGSIHERRIGHSFRFEFKCHAGIRIQPISKRMLGMQFDVESRFKSSVPAVIHIGVYRGSVQISGAEQCGNDAQAIWAKGYTELLDLLDKHARRGEKQMHIDCYGSGEDLDAGSICLQYELWVKNFRAWDVGSKLLIPQVHPRDLDICFITAGVVFSAIVELKQGSDAEKNGTRG